MAAPKPKPTPVAKTADAARAAATAPKPAPKPSPSAQAKPTSTSNTAMLNAAKAQLAKTQASLAAVQKAQADTIAAQKAASTQALIDKAKASSDLIKQKQANKELAATLGPGYKYNSATGKIDKVVVTKNPTDPDPTDPDPTDPDPTDPVVGVYTDPVTGDIYQVTKSGKRILLQAGTKLADDTAAANKDRYDAEQAALAKAAAEKAEKRDAFALVQDTMRSYGFTDAELAELSGYIESSIIDPNVGPNAAILGMRNLKVYKQRFVGNETRVKAGLNALSEGEYLQQEKDYGQYFREYGVQNLATRERMGTLIGNDISAIEAKNRIGLAVDRVKNADANIIKQLKTYYPTLEDKDLVSYFLSPTEYLPELKRKVTASEIGAAALGQGFTDTSRSLGYADYGVDRSGALEGYASLASVLPATSKLGDIYGETGIAYTQQTGEEEFLKASDAAKRKRNILASKERASFEGSAGNAPGAYSTGYLKKSSAAGLI
jgi:hypothetical protein